MRYPHLVASASFGQVHRLVCVAQQLVFFAAVFGVDRHADAGLDVHPVVFQVKRVAEGRQDLFGRGGGVVARLAAFEQHHKFVAAQPRHGVRAAHRLHQPLRHTL